MDQWIRIREAAALTQKPERTLRYQVSQGRLIGKKIGQSWVIETESLRLSGFVKALPSDSPVTEISAKPSPSYGNGTKAVSKTPRDLVSYRILLESRLLFSKNDFAAMLPLIADVLKALAAGYFEFAKPLKSEFYHCARERLSHLWVELDLLKNDQNGERVDDLLKLLSNEVMPALSGAIRRIEGKPDRTFTREI